MSDKLAFKMLGMSSDYTPEISAYKEGVVSKFMPDFCLNFGLCFSSARTESFFCHKNMKFVKKSKLRSARIAIFVIKAKL